MLILVQSHSIHTGLHDMSAALSLDYTLWSSAMHCLNSLDRLRYSNFSALHRNVNMLQGGVDHGDHPQITPVRSASEAEVGGGDAWRIYDYISRHFLGSLSPDATFRRTHASLSAGGEQFSASGVMPLRPGFTAIMPWRVSLLPVAYFLETV